MNLFSSPAHDMNSRHSKRGLRLLLSIFAQEFFHLVTLNVLFVLFSLPIITMPAAYTAMTRVTGHYVQERSCKQFREFTGTFRRELWRTIPAGLPLLLLPGVLVYLGSQHIRSIWNPGSYLIVTIFLASAAVLIMMRNYFFAQMAWTQATAGQALKNSFLLAIVRLFPNLLLLAAHLVLSGIVIYYFPMSTPYLALCVFATMNLFATFQAFSGIRQFILTDTEA